MEEAVLEGVTDSVPETEGVIVIEELVVLVTEAVFVGVEVMSAVTEDV